MRTDPYLTLPAHRPRAVPLVSRLDERRDVVEEPQDLIHVRPIART